MHYLPVSKGMQRLSEGKLCTLLHRQLPSAICNTLTLTCRMNSTKWMPSVAAKRISSVRDSEPSCRYLWKKEGLHRIHTKKLCFLVMPNNVDPSQYKKLIPLQRCPSKTADSESECLQRACRVSQKNKTSKINQTSTGKKGFTWGFVIYVLAACEVSTKCVCPHCSRCHFQLTDGNRVREL